jgi:hypothetical protein
MDQTGFPATTGNIGVPVTDEEIRDNAGDAMNEAIQTTPGSKRVPEMDSNTERVDASDPIPTPSDPVLPPEES